MKRDSVGSLSGKGSLIFEIRPAYRLLTPAYVGSLHLLQGTAVYSADFIWYERADSRLRTRVADADYRNRLQLQLHTSGCD